MKTIGEKLDDLLDRQTNAYLDSTAEPEGKVCKECESGKIKVWKHKGYLKYETQEKVCKKIAEIILGCDVEDKCSGEYDGCGVDKKSATEAAAEIMAEVGKVIPKRIKDDNVGGNTIIDQVRKALGLKENE